MARVGDTARDHVLWPNSLDLVGVGVHLDDLVHDAEDAVDVCDGGGACNACLTEVEADKEHRGLLVAFSEGLDDPRLSEACLELRDGLRGQHRQQHLPNLGVDVALNPNCEEALPLPDLLAGRQRPRHRHQGAQKRVRSQVEGARGTACPEGQDPGPGDEQGQDQGDYDVAQLEVHQHRECELYVHHLRQDGVEKRRAVHASRH
mmetsp:Transcript_52555/g.128447  ORF Transcript_52555/g.128447 Transcript_52555/m.128447 type:complete len:204 (+) Transcript_52555:61-672(+)